MSENILVINPGSTSTKIGVFNNGKEIFTESVSHSAKDLAVFSSVADQLSFREQTIRAALKDRNFDIKTLACVVGRGGLLKPIKGGIYKVSEAMKAELKVAKYGEHASNLGALIADAIAKELAIPAYIADPVVVDELSDIARVCGHKLFKKQSIFHALNQKAVARRWAAEHGKNYSAITLIVAHLGGGVSVGLHRNGSVIDVNNALNGEGPFSPERSGTMPAGALAKLCFSGTVTEKDVMKMIVGQGGVVSLYNTNDMRVLEKNAEEGDAEANLVYDAFIYNIAKAIGSLAAAASGKVDGIIITGGIAHSKKVQAELGAMINWIAPVVVYPGEGELEALALAGHNGLKGEAVEYK